MKSLRLGFLVAAAFCSLSADQPSKAAPFAQGDSLSSSSYPAGYSAPACTKISHGRDWFFSASFLYWDVGEEGMELALAAAIGPTATQPSVVGEILAQNAEVLIQKFEYTPGFQVAAGLNLTDDDWVGQLEYTRIRSETHVSKSAPESVAGGSLSIWLPAWFSQISPTGDLLAASHLSSTWCVTINFVDGTVSRPYYLGRKLTMNPYGGLRAYWINQNLTVKAQAVPFGEIDPPINPMVSHNSSDAWGIGPRAGIDANWLICSGLRVGGHVGASLLFTQFTSIRHKEDAISTLSIAPTYGAHEPTINCVRPMIEAGIGMGWGTYFCKQHYHFDLSASYDFNYLWNQNMMRKLWDFTWLGASSSAGALYTQGLTLTIRLNF